MIKRGRRREPTSRRTTDLVIISDDTKLLRVLTAVGVAVDPLEKHFYGTFDYVRMIEVPGPGAGERAFSFYGMGEAPAPRKHKPAAQKSGQPGLFRRLSKG